MKDSAKDDCIFCYKYNLYNGVIVVISVIMFCLFRQWFRV